MSKSGRLVASIIIVTTVLIRVHIAGTVTFTEFSVPTANSTPFGITLGPDGSLWFTELTGNKIGRITTEGVIAEFPVATANSQPHAITAGPDGTIWFTEYSGNKIGRITPAGVITEFVIPTSDSQPGAITAGPDGNLWFTEYSGSKIGRITTEGVIAEFPIPGCQIPQRICFPILGCIPVSFMSPSHPSSITTGPDGNLWFTSTGCPNEMMRMSPAGAILNEFSMPTSDSRPLGINNGTDGNLWFCEEHNYRIGKITTEGLITEFPLPTHSFCEGVITAGPDGNLWFIDHTIPVGDTIAQITTEGAISEFTLPAYPSNLGDIAIGPDGNLWFTAQYGNAIVKAVLNPTPMPVPLGQEIFGIAPPVPLPIIDPAPVHAAPVGLGLVNGGNLFSIVIGLGPFSAPVDIYFAINAPAISPSLLILTPAGLSSSSLVPWISGTSDGIFVPLLQHIPLSSVPGATYTFYVGVTPAGSIDSYYIWQTSFTRP